MKAKIALPWTYGTTFAQVYRTLFGESTYGHLGIDGSGSVWYMSYNSYPISYRADEDPTTFSSLQEAKNYLDNKLKSHGFDLL